MATFKVNDRVRLAHAPAVIDPAKAYRLGKTATIVRIPSVRPGSDCDVMIDGAPSRITNDGSCACSFSYLEPLTDPKADQFIEWVKKIKPEPVAVPVAELQRTK